ALMGNESREAGSVACARIVLELHTLVYAPVDHVLYRGLKMRVGQALAVGDISLIKELVAGNRDPVHIAEPAADAHAGAVLGVSYLGRDAAAPPQQRERRLLVLAGALDVHDRMTRDAACALRFRAELAGRAKLDIKRKQPFVGGVGPALDDDAIRFQHEPGQYAVFTAASEQAGKDKEERREEPGVHLHSPKSNAVSKNAATHVAYAACACANNHRQPARMGRMRTIRAVGATV